MSTEASTCVRSVGKVDGAMIRRAPASRQSGSACSDDLQPVSGAIGEVYPSAGKQTAIDTDSTMVKKMFSKMDLLDSDATLLKDFMDEEKKEVINLFYEDDDTSGKKSSEPPTQVNNVNSWKKESEGWIRLRSVMDSGCGESVIPPAACPGYKIQESPGSKRGQEYVTASKHEIPNLGEQILSIITDEENQGKLKYQVADVSRPLTAVSEVCDAGNRVLYGRNGGVILNVESGKETWFGREKNIYVFEIWVKPADESPADFRRPGR